MASAHALGTPSRPGRLMAGVWLAYVGFVFLDPYISGAGVFRWGIAVASVVVFIALYFGVFAARRPAPAALFVVAMAILGFALHPFNAGSTTYAIYSAAMAGFVMRRSRAVLYVVVLTVIAVGLLAFTRRPFEYWMAFQVLFIFVVGVGNIFVAEDQRRSVALRRAHEEVEEMATLAERERIARDLHDLLGHTLSVIALKSELAAKLADRDPERAAQEIRDVEHVAREALAQVRSAVEGYRARGFAGELWNAEQVLAAAGVRLETDIAPVALPARHEGVLALALREAVTNIVRHAQASVCRVQLREDQGHVQLTIRDDGVGGGAHEGHGLAGMRERVAATGGDVSIDRTQGTWVTITMPVPAVQVQAELVS